METHWTDRRLDELNGRVEELAKRTERGFVEFRTEIQTGFERMEQHLERLDATFEQRLEQIDAKLEHVDKRFDEVEIRLKGVEKSVFTTEAHVDDLRERTGRVEKRMDGMAYALIGFAASLTLAMVSIAVNL